MEKTEPSFAPEWLKGASGVGGTVPQVRVSHQDDSESVLVLNGRQSQQLNASTTNLADYDSSRGSTYADIVFSSSRKNHTVNNSALTDRNEESSDFQRSHSSVTRGSLNRGLDALDWDQDGYKGNGMQEKRDIRVRVRDKLVGHGLDEKDRDIKTLETGMLYVQVMGSPGKFQSSAQRNRSQSVGLSPKIPNSIGWKFAENGGLASSIQNADFERNFPSLASDEKTGSLPTSPGSSFYPFWKVQSRADWGRSVSPSLPVGGNSTGQPINGGADAWSSALADIPLVNGYASVNISSASSSGLTSASSCTSTAVTPAVPLNMAEALVQNPPQSRTPPQSLVDTQRLEELALKQSRQLIPVVPSLHKTMSDKNKLKSLWWMDNGVKNSTKFTQSNSSQINSLQRSFSGSSRPVSAKQQGKLLLSRSCKDMLAAGTSRLEVPSATIQVVPVGTMPISNSQLPHGTGVSRMGRKKPVLDHRGSFAGVDACQAKEHLEDKRAQGRIDFFNALRKKAANDDVASSLQVNTRMDSAGCLQELQDEVTDTISDFKCPSMEGSPVMGGDSLFQSSLYMKKHDPLPVDSEEEEVAFMRSIGWEENAENSELTEEEINAFYEMRAQKAA